MDYQEKRAYFNSIAKRHLTEKNEDMIKPN